MASRYNASISTIGIGDKKTADALRRLMENSTYLHGRLAALERGLEVRLARLRKSLPGAGDGAAAEDSGGHGPELLDVDPEAPSGTEGGGGQ